ncbi:hypothetical protein JRQ81_010889 [Phrynocephalus forsythii]|uniref:Uncharacterized protein n=1 Tax=Phrynocephalus forsythii TaxID=171643 RepID=A0A9Q1AQW5_9SAUR|nr:hypothetical protein JRQ81_010889 [Phrynocephalus forsythii]
MSIAHTAGQYMLSDALLPDPNGSRAKGLRLELSCDRIVKFVTVGLPLFFVSLVFAREFSTVKTFDRVLFSMDWIETEKIEFGSSKINWFDPGLVRLSLVVTVSD